MTDIRERVARAIIKARTPWVKDANLPDISIYTMELAAADAALLACGYAEMRNALEFVVHEVGWHGNGEKDSEQFYCEHCDQTNENHTMIAHKPECIVAVARSILERTGDKP